MLQNISDTVISIVIPSGAHHSDLMFQNALDGEDVLAARRLEVHFFVANFLLCKEACVQGEDVLAARRLEAQILKGKQKSHLLCP